MALERMEDQAFEAWTREPCPDGEEPYAHLLAIAARTLMEARRARSEETRLAAENRRLREALEPFAAIARETPDVSPAVFVARLVAMEHLRRAAEVVNG